MGRKLPRSFFWIDQQLIRGGLWLRLSAGSRLAYLALSASCDREGISIWSRNKLMELAAATDPDQWQACLTELENLRLIEPVAEHCPPAIRLLPLDAQGTPPAQRVGDQAGVTAAIPAAAGPITVHTQTTVYLGHPAPGGKPAHAEPGTTD